MVWFIEKDEKRWILAEGLNVKEKEKSKNVKIIGELIMYYICSVLLKNKLKFTVIRNTCATTGLILYAKVWIMTILIYENKFSLHIRLKWRILRRKMKNVLFSVSRKNFEKFSFNISLHFLIYKPNLNVLIPVISSVHSVFFSQMIMVNPDFQWERNGSYKDYVELAGINCILTCMPTKNRPKE